MRRSFDVRWALSLGLALSLLLAGLTEAAVAALQACRFSPGEKDGKPVPVRVRGFKIRFVLQEAE